jgi:hypothetical protein
MGGGVVLELVDDEEPIGGLAPSGGAGVAAGEGDGGPAEEAAGGRAGAAPVGSVEGVVEALVEAVEAAAEAVGDGGVDGLATAKLEEVEEVDEEVGGGLVLAGLAGEDEEELVAPAGEDAVEDGEEWLDLIGMEGAAEKLAGEKGEVGQKALEMLGGQARVRLVAVEGEKDGGASARLGAGARRRVGAGAGQGVVGAAPGAGSTPGERGDEVDAPVDAEEGEGLLESGAPWLAGEGLAAEAAVEKGAGAGGAALEDGEEADVAVGVVVFGEGFEDAAVVDADEGQLVVVGQRLIGLEGEGVEELVVVVVVAVDAAAAADGGVAGDGVDVAEGRVGAGEGVATAGTAGGGDGRTGDGGRGGRVGRGGPELGGGGEAGMVGAARRIGAGDGAGAAGQAVTVEVTAAGLAAGGDGRAGVGDAAGRVADAHGREAAGAASAVGGAAFAAGAAGVVGVAAGVGQTGVDRADGGIGAADGVDAARGAGGGDGRAAERWWRRCAGFFHGGLRKNKKGRDAPEGLSGVARPAFARNGQ